LKNIPWVVFKGGGRTSTFLIDSVRTISNIANNFKPGEVYNICGNRYHTIEELSDTVLKVTGADPSLVEYRDSEVLTTLHKRVDNNKARIDFGHEDTVTLEEGIRQTVEWMKEVYKI